MGAPPAPLIAPREANLKLSTPLVLRAFSVVFRPFMKRQARRDAPLVLAIFLSAGVVERVRREG
jgi:hypothetical protein